MKKIKYILVIVSLVLLASCSTVKPTYNSSQESLQEYQQEVQNYYNRVGK